MKRALAKIGVYALFALLLACICLLDAYGLFLIGFSLLSNPALSLVATVVFGLLTALLIDRLAGPLLDVLLCE